MSDENRISILICKDAGSASRTLLSREDLRVRWALTPAEAEAVIRWTKCAVCITRAPLAKPVIQACQRAERDIATVVLLEPERWASWRDYYDVGATAVLQATAADQLLDAISDETGVSLRTAPRVPFETEVRRIDNPQTSWTSIDLSATGMSISDFPEALGSEVELTFELGGTSHRCSAIVSRIYRSGARMIAGVAFQHASIELQTKLDEVISGAQAKHHSVVEPDEEFDPLDDGTVLTLRTSTIENNAQELMRALAAGGKVTGADARERWLHAACARFSSLEVAAIRTPRSAPGWAHDAVLARLRAYQIRERAMRNPPSDAEVREIFGLCQRLADSSAGADEASLVQVTNIRAEILRALYDPESLDA